MIRPAVVSLCAESAPYVLDLMRQPDVEQVRVYMLVHSNIILWHYYYRYCSGFMVCEVKSIGLEYRTFCRA